ncbi:MAG TPA: ribonuclease HI [Flavobacteriaceae bacterium]|nr:MAG: Ribonuclease HI [Flavobacteriaceae bacterium]HCQ24665.1 ribonuclease HI [Flavobacteriaceae bacterium]|tara:strand:- start:89625 stop:90128 length:504 start_codon:yes stop_codon:yes gene_type:complete
MSKTVYLYTDGSALGNPGPGGYGIHLEWAGQQYQKSFSQGFELTTNNRMELMAVIVGLELLQKHPMEVVVYSDSKYVVDAVEKKWVFGWEKKQFKGKKNEDLWQRFLKVYRKHKVHFQWIKGHNQHPQNEWCDSLAVKAAKSKKKIKDVYYENYQRLQNSPPGPPEK